LANIQHKNIVNADLHEPKDISTAVVNTVYVANGAGTGTWKQAPYHYTLQTNLPDVSAPSSTYLVATTAGTIDSIQTVLHGTITVADNLITFFINGIPVTNSTVTVAFTGSAAGSRFSSTPTANNTVAIGDLITVTSNGAGSTNSIILSVALRIKVTV
jgi:hypothetical protein